jgi:hypothetical protein
MRKLSPAPVPCGKALPAPVATCWPCLSCLCRSGARCASLFFASSSLWSGAPRRLRRPKENTKQKRQTRTACTQRPPTAPYLYLRSPFFALKSLWGDATIVLGRCLSLSQPWHAAAIPLSFDALPRRVTPKLSGYIVSQWCALTALGF